MKKQNRLSKIASSVHFTTNLFKKTVAGITIVAMLTTQANADNFIKGMMKDLFQDSMSNFTSAKAFHTTTRGVISGGSVTVRSKVFNNQLISFVPPSIKAGCNGLDIFLGSFSFINADQLIQLFRTIAANAVGYLFMLALDVVSPEIQQLMQKFGDMVREINSLTADSCRAAQGVVNLFRGDTSYFNKIKEAGESIVTSAKGLADDVKSWFPSTGKTNGANNSGEALQKAVGETETTKMGLQGNFLWTALKGTNQGIFGQSIVARLRTAGMDKVEETIMSLTGSFIATKYEPSAPVQSNVSTDSNYKMKSLPPLLNLKTLVEGKNSGEPFTIYKCDDDKKCENPTVDTTSMTDTLGLAQILYKSLCDTDNLNESCRPTSAVHLMINNGNGTGTLPNNTAIGSLSVLPPDFLNILTNEQISYTGVAGGNATETLGGLFVQKNIRIVALEIVKDLANQIFDATERQIEGIDSPSKGNLKADIEKYRKRLNDEYIELTKKSDYGILRDNIRAEEEKLIRWGKLHPSPKGVLTYDPTTNKQIK